MAKLSEKKKVEPLESAVLRNDVAEVRRLYAEHGSFEFTARALGLACRFCGLEMVKALVENGAAFQYDNDTPFKTKYGVVYERKDASYPANYGTMISLKSFKQARWSQTVTRGIDPQCAFSIPPHILQ